MAQAQFQTQSGGQLNASQVMVNAAMRAAQLREMKIPTSEWARGFVYMQAILTAILTDPFATERRFDINEIVIADWNSAARKFFEDVPEDCVQMIQL